MIGELFKAILITSLAGSALAVVIRLLRPITKKLFGYSWHYYIWLCVLFVMLMPVRFNVNTTSAPNIATQTVQTQQEAVSEQPETTENIVQTAPIQKPQLLQKATVIWDRIIYNRMNILAYVWLIGAIALMLLNVVRYVRLNIKIRKNGEVISCPETRAYTDRKINVRVWENVASPFMTGVFRPTLILPKTELSEEQLHNILRHEMTHFKRHDILYKWFAEFVKCVHWFNPMAWYVSKQIAAECEISCDMAVTKNMTGSEEMSYVSTILSLLPTGKSKQLPLTTQMASSKKFLKRRFVMIKNKKTTSRFMSVLSAVIAVVMLSTTVFASGLLSDLTTDDYTIEILNNGEKIEFKNKPFIENGEVYVPLRETLEKLGFDKNNSNIVWKDGKVGLSLVQTNGNAGAYCIKIGYNGVWCSQESTVLDDTALDYIIDNSRGYIDGPNSVPHILKNSFTYISIEYFDYIVYRFLNVRDENNELYKITYNTYDKSGNIIDYSGFYHIVMGEYTIKIPESWEGKYYIHSGNNAVNFVQKATYDKYGEGSGTLFKIEKTRADNADEILNMLGGSRLLYKDDVYAYIFEVPTDVQYPVWEGRDENDIEIAAEYEKMFKDVAQIAGSFRDESNAEHLSYEEMKKLQAEVDIGHFPWRLDPNAVILEFMDKQGLSGGKVTALAGAETVSATYVCNNIEYEIELYRPIYKWEQGILVVKKFLKKQQLSFDTVNTQNQQIEKN